MNQGLDEALRALGITDGLFTTININLAKTVIGRPILGSATEYEIVAVLVSAYGNRNGTITQTWRLCDGRICRHELLGGDTLVSSTLADRNHRSRNRRRTA